MPSKSQTLTRAGISEDLYDKVGYSRKYSAELAGSVFQTIKQKLLSGYNVKLSGFGHFILRNKKSRVGRDPQRETKIIIPARRVLVFHPSPLFKKRINGK